LFFRGQRARLSRYYAHPFLSPSVIGNRTNISIKQSFDFPTAYKFKNQISDIKNEQAELEYIKYQKELLMQTRFICYDLIYTNALKVEFSKRLEHAQSITKSYKAKFDIGEANILEYNKASLNELNSNTELESVEIARTALFDDLMRLNGGVFIDFNESEYPINELTDDFEQWYALAEKSNPVLNWLKQELAINQKQEKLNKAQALPKFQAGYMSEALSTEQFRGIVVGLSVPLWENKNKVKYAKAYSLAMESIAMDNKLQFYTQLKSLHTKAISLKKSTNAYRANLLSFDNSALLIKALEKGEINLIDYMLELSIYYQSFDKLLKLEKELNKTQAELNRYM